MNLHETIQKGDYSAGMAALKRRFGDRFVTSISVREAHGSDSLSRMHGAPPDAVLYMESTEEVVEAVNICRDTKTPIVPFGSGTSIEGNTAAVHGGVSLDLSRMNAVLRVSPEDQDCTVQAGVTRQGLNSYLRDTGLFFPIDACQEASLGGMVGTRASGTNAMRYGTMRENVLSLKVVLADGRVIKTGSRARKSAAGYDLTRLFVGSAGTLGIVTEVTLRLHGIPAHVAAATCAFPSVEAAVNTVISLLQTGVPMAKVELMDAAQIDATNKYSKLNMKVAPYLFFEFEGTPKATEGYAQTAREIAGEFGGSEFHWASSADERNRLWEARHKVGPAALALREGSVGWPTDVTVPISRLADCVVETQRDIEQVSIPGPICGHVGDGNFHVAMIIDPNKPSEFEEAAWVNDRLIERALSMDGTCTGEHGVGTGKMRWMTTEFGADAIDVMRMVKHALDPHNLLNPSKIFSWTAE